VVESLIEMLSGIPEQWRVFCIALFPIAEFRAAFPLGIFWGMSTASAFSWAIAGNFLPIFPLLIVLKLLYRRVVEWQRLGAPLRRLALIGERKSEQVRRYGILGLAIFVAIPLPGTGAWTGCLIAVVMNLPLLRSAVAIAIGMLVAAMIVTSVVIGGIALWQTFYGQIIVITFIAAVIIVMIWHKKIKKIK
jgi:uncharacterized membrane protein